MKKMLFTRPAGGHDGCTGSPCPGQDGDCTWVTAEPCAVGLGVGRKAQRPHSCPVTHSIRRWRQCCPLSLFFFIGMCVSAFVWL